MSSEKGEKRKRQVNGGSDGRKRKEVEDDGEKQAAIMGPSEARVEEFFALLRRFHSAVRSLKKDNGGAKDLCGLTERDVRLEEVETESNNGEKNNETREGVEENQVQLLDLNLEPVSSDTNSV